MSVAHARPERIGRLAADGMAMTTSRLTQNLIFGNLAVALPLAPTGQNAALAGKREVIVVARHRMTAHRPT
jgi:hypothetical protein